MQHILQLSRRNFIKNSLAASVGSLMLGFTVKAGPDTVSASRPESITELTNWLQFTTDNQITIIIPSAEMGQGVSTGMAQILAEELDVEWQQINVIQAPFNKIFSNPERGIQFTGGSSSIKEFYLPLRQVGAGARQMLLKAAAKELKISIESLSTDQGFIIASGKKYPYGDFVKTASTLDQPEEVLLKTSDQFRLIGKSLPRIESLSKSTGAAEFGIDVKIDNMLVASVIQSPVFGGEPRNWDEQAAMQQQGVHKVVALPNAIAVIADKFWQAKKALVLLKPEFSRPDTDDPAENTLQIVNAFKQALDEQGKGKPQSDRVIDVEYEVPYLAHATMEPMNCTAHVQSQRVDIWLPTQGPEAVAQATEEITGLDQEQIFVHNTFLGGGYGRRIETDFVTQAVLLSQAVNQPVKLIWSREEDMQHDFYRPAVVCRYQIGLDEQNNPSEWYHQFASSSIFKRITKGSWIPLTSIIGDPIMQVGTDDPPYVPEEGEVEAEYVIVDAAIPVGFWPSVSYSHNTFFRESVIDEAAYIVGEDPYQYRSRLLKNIPREKTVLDLVASKSMWRKVASGRFQGIAVESAFQSYFAMVAEISVEDDQVTLHKITCAMDCGVVINPDMVKAQIEFGISYALSAAAFGEVTLKEGRIVQSNFHDYPMLRINQMPEVNVHLVESQESPSGIGETGVPTLAPALTNAIYAATKKRVRKLPLTNAGFHLAALDRKNTR